MSLHVREMRLDEVGLRIDYFHQASDDYLARLGVDRGRLPSREKWAAWYRRDYARPLEQRENYSLVWELDGVVVGFSSTDQIVFGEQAFMHLHVLEAKRRASGLGTRFVRLSADAYFETLRLRRLYAQPNAFNVAPNRTLQRAGFRYEHTTTIRPSEINVVQPVTRWVLDADRWRQGASRSRAGTAPRSSARPPASAETHNSTAKASAHPSATSTGGS